jgi:electron transfer flavoprotein alpha subunit
MSKLLVVLFEVSEAKAAIGFGKALGLSFDLASVSGDAPPADALAQDIGEIAGAYSHIAAVSSMQSKDVMGRLAGLIDAGMVTDVISVEGQNRFRRPVIAGSLIATVEALSEPVVITFRPANFAEEGDSAIPDAVSVQSMAKGRTRRISASGRKTGRPDLGQAKVVVSGGRPLRDAETFEKVIGGLADQLGGAVGATRAAVDSGIASNELQVGQTGKIVAPDLYIAAGISGSTQHMAGIKDSKVIVAINKDPDAPIFDSADLGIVGDLYDVIPEIRSKLKVTN